MADADQNKYIACFWYEDSTYYSCPTSKVLNAEPPFQINQYIEAKMSGCGKQKYTGHVVGLAGIYLLHLLR